MPRTKKKITLKEESKTGNNSNPKIRWGESYTSLLLGIIVVVVAFVLVFSIIRNHSYNTKATSSTSTENEEVLKELPKSYEVKPGDDLWAISEKIYGSGYNWVDLMAANKLDNPSVIYSGSKLVIPNVKPKAVEPAQPNQTLVNNQSITGKTYTIQRGDCLWEISIRAYGDGYRWPEIAKVNNLTNPDLIFSGNVLQLPR